MNVIISGWPGAGTTTMSLLLAYLLKMDYLYAGGVMKHIAQIHVGTTSGPQYVAFESRFGPKFDQIWEKYSKWKLGMSDNLLMEAKTVGFFIENQTTYEVMLIANADARIARARSDKRLDADNTIRSRDMEVRNRWYTEYSIDLYNINQIRENYDLVVDNSYIDIAKELELVVSALEKDGRFKNIFLAELQPQFAGLVEMFQDKGKPYFRELLKQQKLYQDSAGVITEWQTNFPEEMKELDLHPATLI